MTPFVWLVEDRPSFRDFRCSHVEGPYTMWILLKMGTFVVWPILSVVGVGVSAIAFELGVPAFACYFLLFVAPSQLIALTLSTRYRLRQVSQDFPPRRADSDASDIYRIGFLWATSMAGFILCTALSAVLTSFDPLMWG